MDLTNLGSLPLTTISATMLYQILGPSCRYLGIKGAGYSEQMLENLERMFDAAHKRLGSRQDEEGIVPPRLLKSAMNEGAYTEDVLASSYLGGVLASSKAEHTRDDRGVSINATISRLSTYQIRCHYVLYSCMHDLHQGMSFREVQDMVDVHGLRIGLSGFGFGMGFSAQELDEPDFDLFSILSHTFFGLDREDLIANWKYGGELGEICCGPTALGIELFLWANGVGKKPIEHFYSSEFTPCELSEVVLIRGRKIECKLEDGYKVTVDGYDYRRPNANQRCKLAGVVDENAT